MIQIINIDLLSMRADLNIRHNANCQDLQSAATYLIGHEPRSFDTIFGVSIVILFPRFDDVYKHVQKIVAGFRVNPISLVLGINGLVFQ